MVKNTNEGGVCMSFQVFQCYIKICANLNIRPSWIGLNNFRNSYNK